jgi:AraC family transcriptional regulator
MFEICESSYAANSRMAPHGHAHATMSLVISGEFREHRGGRSELARALSVSLMAAGVDHRDEFGANGAHLLTVQFDEDWLSGSDELPVDDWRWLQGGPAVRVLLQLRDAVRRGMPDAVRDQLVADALAAGAESRMIDTRRPPAWLARVRDAIDDTPTWPRVGELATFAGVHRVHLAREFRRYVGCSVSAYIRRRAVQRALQAIRARPGTLSAAAHEAGFADHAHMCRAFKQETGLAPSAAARAVLS